MAHTGLACPDCEKQTGEQIPLMTAPGRYGFACKNNHIFRDNEELMARNPTKMTVAMKVQKPTGTYTELKLTLPEKLATALRERFKDKLEMVAVPLLTSILDSGAFIVTGLDAERLKEKAGQKIKSPDQLIGIIYSLTLERDEARKEAEAYKNTPGTSSSVDVNAVEGDFVQMALRLKVEDFMAIKDKAKFNAKLPAQYLAEVIQNAILNGWF